MKGIRSQTAGEGSPTPSHLLADISEQVVIDQGKAAHLLSQFQSPLGIEREKTAFQRSAGRPQAFSCWREVGRGGAGNLSPDLHPQPTGLATSDQRAPPLDRKSVV